MINNILTSVIKIVFAKVMKIVKSTQNIIPNKKIIVETQKNFPVILESTRAAPTGEVIQYTITIIASCFLLIRVSNLLHSIGVVGSHQTNIWTSYSIYKIQSQAQNLTRRSLTYI